jgi:signal transduction histidine kinase
MTGPSLADHASRLERELARHARLQQVLLAFNKDAASADNLGPAFATLSQGIDAVFGGRTSVWVHDRNSRELVLQTGNGGVRVPADQPDYPAARGLRLAEPEFLPAPEVPSGPPSDGSADRTLLVPLRGQQRALGVIVIESLGEDAHDGGTVAIAGELSRQLSSAIENKLLLSHVIRKARLDADERAHSQKLAALGQFVAGIAHELNNPLQSVLGHLELLRRNRKLPRALASDVWLIYREADRAARIVGRLLVFAGARRAGRRKVSPNAALARALSLRARASRAAGIALIRRLDPAVPRISGDALLLQQAFLNIIVNAEQAIGARRTAAPGVSTQDCIDASTRVQRGAVIVEIRDTGPGIAPDVLPRIFEPFFTTKEVGQGTGLGLALTHGIIQEHGGSISARPHPRGGTVFRIELPIPKHEARPEAQSTRPEALRRRHG